jgi:magnesium transporter
MITTFIYTKKELKEIEPSEIKEYVNKKATYVWVKASNLTKEESKFLKETFNLHPTTVEDMTSQQTRVKYEEFEDYTVIIFKSIKEIKGNEVETSDISAVLGEEFLITINEDYNETIEELSKNTKKIENILRRGEDYITHYIIDKEVDRYLKIKIELGEDLKQIEREFMEKQSKETLNKIFTRELIFLELRQLSESMSDLCLNLTKPADNYIDNDLIPYFRDVYDHIFKTTEGYKTMLGRMNGMKNMYASIASIKTNETMKVLTILMAIMMPLTVITGFFGMNVKLPLQNHPDAHLFILGLMVLSGAFLVWISMSRGWIAKGEK